MSIVLITTVNPVMAAALVAVSFAMAALIFWLARSGTPIHRDYRRPRRRR